ncbi:MAG: hypothetical protein LBJ36_02105 [Synergistaceae bacterium]|nr:hypothetical protein [Synergistaceae bacterium]
MITIVGSVPLASAALIAASMIVCVIDPVEMVTVATPVLTLPFTSTGRITAPSSSMSGVSGSLVPGSSVPGSSVPGSSVPGSSVPGSSVPGSSVSGSSVPGSVVAAM